MTFKVEGLPSSVRVAGHDVAIKVQSEQWRVATDHHGEFSQVDVEILVAPTFPTASRAAEIVIHELIHAVWWGFNARSQDGEEQVVTTLAVGLQQVWRDNPDLIAWIEKVTRP